MGFFIAQILGWLQKRRRFLKFYNTIIFCQLLYFPAETELGLKKTLMKTIQLGNFALSVLQNDEQLFIDTERGNFLPEFNAAKSKVTIKIDSLKQENPTYSVLYFCMNSEESAPTTRHLTIFEGAQYEGCLQTLAIQQSEPPYFTKHHPRLYVVDIDHELARCTLWKIGIVYQKKHFYIRYACVGSGTILINNGQVSWSCSGLMKKSSIQHIIKQNIDIWSLINPNAKSNQTLTNPEIEIAPLLAHVNPEQERYCVVLEWDDFSQKGILRDLVQNTNFVVTCDELIGIESSHYSYLVRGNVVLAQLKTTNPNGGTVIESIKNYGEPYKSAFG
jgi:hypothetical protein